MKQQLKNHLAALTAIGLMTMQPGPARQANGGYQGLEYFGSSQISKLELEKELGLRGGSSFQAGVKAIEHLQEKLIRRRIKANVDIVNSGDSFFVSVDVMDTGLPSVPVRNLTFPHHVALASDVPFSLLNDILLRREMLAAQGKAVTETYEDGIKHFSDEPCEQYAAKLLRQVPSMRNELLSVVASDPDPARRSKAIEVLNWDGNAYRTCIALIPAVDDAAEQVRVSAARFLYPRINILPENFPWTELVEVFSHQLARPSHVDRLLALKALNAIARSNDGCLHAIKVFDQDKLKDIQATSILADIKEPAQQLLEQCSTVQDALEEKTQASSKPRRTVEPPTEF